MILSLAPMEGITGHVFRRVHAECFGALDCYYTPFLPPPRVGNRFGGKAFKEIDPANNQGLNVVPQLMSKNADEFVWAAQVLADMGYREVNLNLGCPSGTVVAKGKGSGFLRNLDELEAFLSDVCERSPLPVSVKTRLGLENDDEYERVLESDPSDALAARERAKALLLARSGAADVRDVRAAAAAAPDDVEAQLAVADIDMIGGQIQDAFDRLLDFLAAGHKADIEQVRKRLLEYFAIPEPTDPRLTRARRRLATLMY